MKDFFKYFNRDSNKLNKSLHLKKVKTHKWK